MISTDFNRLRDNKQLRRKISFFIRVRRRQIKMFKGNAIFNRDVSKELKR
jgi:hypothetical protein